MGSSLVRPQPVSMPCRLVAGGTHASAPIVVSRALRSRDYRGEIIIGHTRRKRRVKQALEQPMRLLGVEIRTRFLVNRGPRIGKRRSDVADPRLGFLGDRRHRVVGPYCNLPLRNRLPPPFERQLEPTRLDLIRPRHCHHRRLEVARRASERSNHADI